MLIECDLCGMQLPDDDKIIIRMTRHTEFHEKAWVQHRNTTQGTPNYKSV
jgi:hypothetical protein